MKDRMADLQAKLDSYERRLRSGENDYQDDGEGNPESPTQRQEWLQPDSPSESPVETRSPPIDGTSSSIVGTATTNSVEPDVFDFSKSLLSEKNDRMNRTDNDTKEIFSSPVDSHVKGKDPPKKISAGTDGTFLRCGKRPK